MPYCPEADRPWDVTENSLVSVPVPIPHIKMELGIQVWFFKNIKSGFWSQFKKVRSSSDPVPTNSDWNQWLASH
jgi:hypothetical protein